MRHHHLHHCWTLNATLKLKSFQAVCGQAGAKVLRRKELLLQKPVQAVRGQGGKRPIPPMAEDVSYVLTQRLGCGGFEVFQARALALLYRGFGEGVVQLGDGRRGASSTKIFAWQI